MTHTDFWGRNLGNAHGRIFERNIARKIFEPLKEGER
jgi:hypothetical protein